MLSIVICSKDPCLLDTVSNNVASTIGVPFEILAIDNSKGQYGICKAYNECANRSKFDILCFMHEDIIFHTIGWGMAVVNHLYDKTVGLIGVAGGIYKPKVNSGWWNIPPHHIRRKLIQSDSYLKNSDYILSDPKQEEVADVVNVDGLWFCTHKEVWRQNKFDEANFPGFHFYDLDFSMQVFQNHRICVVYNILIEHKSLGSINASWIESSFVFHHKWHNVLPCFVEEVSAEQKDSIELEAGKEFVNQLQKNYFSKKLILNHILMCFKIRFFDRDNFWLLRNLLLGQFFSNKIGMIKQKVRLIINKK